MTESNDFIHVGSDSGFDDILNLLKLPEIKIKIETNKKISTIPFKDKAGSFHTNKNIWLKTKDNKYVLKPLTKTKTFLREILFYFLINKDGYIFKNLKTFAPKFNSLIKHEGQLYILLENIFLYPSFNGNKDIKENTKEERIIDIKIGRLKSKPQEDHLNKTSNPNLDMLKVQESCKQSFNNNNNIQIKKAEKKEQIFFENGWRVAATFLNGDRKKYTITEEDKGKIKFEVQEDKILVNCEEEHLKIIKESLIPETLSSINNFIFIDALNRDKMNILYLTQKTQGKIFLSIIKYLKEIYQSFIHFPKLEFFGSSIVLGTKIESIEKDKVITFLEKEKADKNIINEIRSDHCIGNINNKNDILVYILKGTLLDFSYTYFDDDTEFEKKSFINGLRLLKNSMEKLI